MIGSRRDNKVTPQRLEDENDELNQASGVARVEDEKEWYENIPYGKSMVDMYESVTEDSLKAIMRWFLDSASLDFTIKVSHHFTFDLVLDQINLQFTYSGMT